MPGMTQEERAAARAELDFDERVELQAQILDLLRRTSTELRQLQMLVDVLPVDVQAPTAALAVVEKLARSKRLERPQGILDTLLRQAHEASVSLARAHGAQWNKIGEALGEDGRNTARDFAHQR